MTLVPKNQLELFGLDTAINEFIRLFKISKFPNKILLSGEKGIGKCTLAYHLINYILSQEEDHPYDSEKFTINENNKSFKLILNKTSPNFTLIDFVDGKKIIDILQIRNLINNINKSSFNNKFRFVLIDNVEYLNINSANALLKVLEEPNDRVHFILINNNRRILSTLKSRCLNFRISLANKQKISISNKILDADIEKLINKDLMNYYLTPGKIYNLVKFSKENNIDLKKLKLKDLLSTIIDEGFYKKESPIKYLIYEFLEFFLINNIPIQYSNYYNYFLNKINDTKRFNLDEESLFIEFKTKILNG
jgi:DNA polymerase III subunit delta'